MKAALISFIALIAIALLVPSSNCEREQAGYNCKGKGCSGCK